MRQKSLLPVCLIAILAGCAASPEPSEPVSAEPPRLVVFVVVDQLGDWVLDEHLELLPPDSLLRRALRDGARHTVAFPYANTATAAGHATLATGVAPSVHGVYANALIDAGGARRPIVDDGQHGVIGNEGAAVSPAVLRTDTVGDRLHAATDGEAVIVGVSMKARAAVLATGASADLAVFYDDDTAMMTTSTWYRPDGRLPPWLAAFNRDQPVEEVFTTWYRENTSPCAHDDAPGEGPFLGWDAVFPHDPADTWKPKKVFGYSAASTPWFFAAARAAIEAEGMGTDAVPDLLVLGISGTDRIGHVWGATSCEYVDNLLRTDRELTALAGDLAERGTVAFVITADHGVARLPEQSPEPGGRLSKERVLATARDAARTVLGDGDWIAGYESSNLYFTPAGDAHRAALEEPVRQALAALEGIGGVYTPAQAPALEHSDQPLGRLAAASMPAGTDADLLVVPARGWFNALSDVPGGGTSHGTPWEYDREVPVLLWGHGIHRAAGERDGDARRVAATLAALLRVPAPAAAMQPPLGGVGGPASQ